jgi:hypothetical protein
MSGLRCDIDELILSKSGDALVYCSPVFVTLLTWQAKAALVAEPEAVENQWWLMDQSQKVRWSKETAVVLVMMKVASC